MEEFFSNFFFFKSRIFFPPFIFQDLGKQGRPLLALLDYFHMSEQQPLFFLGSASKLTFSAFEGWLEAIIDLTSVFLLPLIPFWWLNKGSQSLWFLSFFISSVALKSESVASSSSASDSNLKGLPSFHSLNISSASALNSPSGRKGLSQPS